METGRGKYESAGMGGTTASSPKASHDRSVLTEARCNGYEAEEDPYWQ